MIRKESKDVSMWREIVTGMMVITGTLMTVTTFILFSKLEVSEFSEGVSCESILSTVDRSWSKAPTSHVSRCATV